MQNFIFFEDSWNEVPVETLDEQNKDILISRSSTPVKESLDINPNEEHIGTLDD